MSTIWLNSSDQLIVDNSGNPILCSHCPCGGSSTFQIDTFKVWLWVNVGDTLTTLNWTLTTDHFAGSTVASGTITPTDWTAVSLGTNSFGFDVYTIQWSPFLTGLAAGTYWLQLDNADTTAGVDGGAVIFWDESDGSSAAWQTDGTGNPFVPDIPGQYNLNTVAASGSGSCSFNVSGTNISGLGATYTNNTIFTNATNAWTVYSVSGTGLAVTNSFLLPIP